MNPEPGSLIDRYISSIGNPVTSEEIDTYDRLSRIQSRELGERSDQKLRLVYGWTLLAILVVQIVAVTVFSFLIGFGVISIDRWATTTFIGGTLGEVSAMAFLVVRYLFPQTGVRSRRD